MVSIVLCTFCYPVLTKYWEHLLDTPIGSLAINHSAKQLMIASVLLDKDHNDSMSGLIIVFLWYCRRTASKVACLLTR